jgi:hypothetical protein
MQTYTKRNGNKKFGFNQVLLLISDNHYIELVYLVYLTPLHVSAIHIRHHKLGKWYTKGVKWERTVLTNSGCKVIIKEDQ